MRDRDVVVPEHIPSEDNLADTFTKPLLKTTFQHLALQMLDSKHYDWAGIPTADHVTRLLHAKQWL